MSEQFDASKSPGISATEHFDGGDHGYTSELKGRVEDGVRQPPIGREAVLCPQ
jgi:hypothetical protein